MKVLIPFIVMMALVLLVISFIISWQLGEAVLRFFELAYLVDSFHVLIVGVTVFKIAEFIFKLVMKNE